MFCTASVDDFDDRIDRILEREFKTVVEIGLVPEDVLLPAVEEMRSSLRTALPTMSATELDAHLKHLQNQCREMAYDIFSLAYAQYWN